MFLKFGTVTDEEATAAFEDLEATCQKWLRKWATAEGRKPDDMHDYAVTMAMQLAYEAGVMAAVWGLHRDTLDAAMKVGMASFDKACALQDAPGQG
jgi:cytochrome P450